MLMFFWVLECKAQQLDFTEYLSNFNDVKLPFKIIDIKTSGAIFYPNDTAREIRNKDFIKKFIYNDSVSDSLLSFANYRYEYGVKYDINGNIVVLVKRIKYDGTTVYDIDLKEMILVSYSQAGKFLSSQSISKDNDGWMSYVYFLEKEKIAVQQMKILEFDKPEMACDIETIAYTIDSNGRIKKIPGPPMEGLVVWDEEKQKLELKQMIMYRR